jgi:hypothetical protein
MIKILKSPLGEILKPKSTQGRLGFEGVTSLFFMLFDFYRLDSQNETCDALANLG